MFILCLYFLFEFLLVFLICFCDGLFVFFLIYCVACLLVCMPVCLFVCLSLYNFNLFVFLVSFSFIDSFHNLSIGLHMHECMLAVCMFNHVACVYLLTLVIQSSCSF